MLIRPKPQNYVPPTDWQRELIDRIHVLNASPDYSSCCFVRKRADGGATISTNFGDFEAPYTILKLEDMAPENEQATIRMLYTKGYDISVAFEVLDIARNKCIDKRPADCKFELTKEEKACKIKAISMLLSDSALAYAVYNNPKNKDSLIIVTPHGKQPEEGALHAFVKNATTDIMLNIFEDDKKLAAKLSDARTYLMEEIYHLVDFTTGGKSDDISAQGYVAKAAQSIEGLMLNAKDWFKGKSNDAPDIIKKAAEKIHEMRANDPEYKSRRIRLITGLVLSKIYESYGFGLIDFDENREMHLKRKYSYSDTDYIKRTESFAKIGSLVECLVHKLSCEREKVVELVREVEGYVSAQLAEQVPSDKKTPLQAHVEARRYVDAEYSRHISPEEQEKANNYAKSIAAKVQKLDKPLAETVRSASVNLPYQYGK